MSYRAYFVTGGAGFIGSHMADYLIKQGKSVVVYDNFSTGLRRFITHRPSQQFTVIEGDLLNKSSLTKAMRGCDCVIHFAANADVRFGTNHPSKDLEQNCIATHNVLEAMRENYISKIAFASTGSIYGEAVEFPTPELTRFPIQTSLYGASKLAAEGLIQAYCEGFQFQSWIFRFVSILGERYTHGHVFDFYKQLLKDPTQLHILGDGHQRKSYLYIQDCLTAIDTAITKSKERVNIFNLGTDEYCEVNQSVHWICEHLKLNPEKIYSGGHRGWIGDSPFIFLDTQRIRALGWQPTVSIQDAVVKTLDYLMQNQWILGKRA